MDKNFINFNPTKLFIKLAELVAQRRLGEVQFSGGLVDAAGVGNAAEVFQLSKFHGPSPSIDIKILSHGNKNNTIPIAS